MTAQSPKPVAPTEARRAAWVALSHLFLDTEISELHAQIVQALNTTGYPTAALETMLAEEVYPVCCWNLWAPAGEWAGIDEHWLTEQIQKRRGTYRSAVLRVLGRRFVRKNDDWRQIKRRLDTNENEA